MIVHILKTMAVKSQQFSQAILSVKVVAWYGLDGAHISSPLYTKNKKFEYVLRSYQLTGDAADKFTGDGECSQGTIINMPHQLYEGIFER